MPAATTPTSTSAALGKVFESGFFHTGTRSSFRGRTHGHPIDTWRTPTWRLVVQFSDNHDQIGNRAKRVTAEQDQSGTAGYAAAMLTLLSPFTSMIFMGEEWGAATPWRFFTSHPEPEAAEIRAGRLEEFAQMDWDTSDVPDPQDPRTFEVSRLDWSELEQPCHAELLELTRRLISIRRTYPDFTDPSFDQGRALSNDEAGWLLLESMRHDHGGQFPRPSDRGRRGTHGGAGDHHWSDRGG